MADKITEARVKLDELLETTGMPDKTVDFIDSLDKWYRDKGFFTPKQMDAIGSVWKQYVENE